MARILSPGYVLLASAGLLVSLCAPGPSHSGGVDPQTKRQLSCIRAMNKAGARLGAAQGKVNIDCVRKAGDEKLTTADADSCLTADVKGKIARAKAKVEKADAAKCSEDLPDFGYAGAAAVSDAAVANELGLMEDLFGSDLDQALFVDSLYEDGATCQVFVVKLVEKLAASRLKEFTSCKTKGLKDASIDDNAGIEACLPVDENGKVASAVAKLLPTIKGRCDAVDLGEAFPGKCQSAAADLEALADCLTFTTECRMCITINDMDELDTDCDVHDDGLSNGSCPRCGNGIIEVGEQCDDSGQSATCDHDCTVAMCGDGLRNPSAGEECDDGNLISGDDCDVNCTFTRCGNGVLTNNEECEDGNTMSGDGCNGQCECEPGSTSPGCQHPQCPARAELEQLAGTGGPCVFDLDCPAGSCDQNLGRCVTQTVQDIGWTGLVHDADVDDGLVTPLRLSCAGPPPTCGQCVVRGLDPSTGLCRCQNDNLTECDEPFVPDDDDCGGSVCNCYDGPPIPTSEGGTAVCALWRYTRDVTGTLDVDTGERTLDKHFNAMLFFGEDVLIPCPYCEGDSVPDDGVRDGTCVLGRHPGVPCDVNAIHQTFPAPGGGGHSLDCFPDAGANISGEGIRVDMTETTGTQSLEAGVECGLSFMPGLCPCGVCSQDSSQVCTSNADCFGLGDCAALGSGQPRPNGCSDGVCTDVGGGEGECVNDPPGMFCDGVVGADGVPIVDCTSDQDCDDVDCGGGVGSGCGQCTVEGPPNKCFVYPIEAVGAPDPFVPISVTAFCAPPTQNLGLNGITGLPGPLRLVRQERATYQCASDSAVEYLAGVGGCP